MHCIVKIFVKCVAGNHIRRLTAAMPGHDQERATNSIVQLQYARFTFRHNKLVFFMTRENASSLTTPLPSWSASSIISFSSSSVMLSPRSWATRLRSIKRDLPSLVVVEEPEGLQKLFLGVPIQNLECHHLQKLLGSDCATAVVVDIRYHLLDLFLLRLETQSSHCRLQLFEIDLS